MANLILTPTKRYFGFGDKNDYCVLDGGRVIGRILMQPHASEGQPWFWTITDRYSLPSVHSRGHSSTREQAMTELKARWLEGTTQSSAYSVIDRA